MRSRSFSQLPICSFVFALLAVQASSQLSAQTYTITTIQSFQPNGENKSGVLVGQYGGIIMGTYASGDFYTTINDPQLPKTGGNTELFGINDEGVIVGGSDVRGFVLKNGVFTTLTVSSARTYPYSINNSGVIAGGYLSGNDILGFVLAGTKVDTFPSAVVGINNHGDLLFSNGYLEVGGVLTLIAYPGGMDTSVSGLNDSDSVVGFYSDEQFVSHGFVYSKGSYTTIDYPNATLTRTQAINNEGRVAGFALTNSGLFGFIAKPAN